MSTYKTYREVEITVGYDYQPFEKQVLYGDDPYPGCEASVTVNDITIGDENSTFFKYVTEHFSAEEIAHIEEEIFDHLHPEPEE